MNDVMTVEGIGMLTAAVMAILFITQYIKFYLKKIDTRLIALCLSLLMMIALTIVNGGGVVAYFVAVADAVFITLSAMGLYEITFKKYDDIDKINKKKL